MSKWRVLLAVCSFAVLYQIFWRIRHKRRKLPNGPSDLMSLYYLAKMFLIKRTFDPTYIVTEFMKHYGKDGLIYHSVLIYKVVQITSSKMAKQILNDKNALYRPVFGEHKNSDLHIDIESTADGTKPFANINGKPWEKRRKLAQSIMFRMCNQSDFINKILQETMQNVVFPELDEICNSNGNILWYPMDTMKYCAYNTIYYANNGSHTKRDDPLFHKSIEVITETFNLFQSGIIYAVLPKYLMFLVKLNPYSDYHKILKVMKKREKLSRAYQQRKEEEEEEEEEEEDINKESMYYVDYIEKELTESEVRADMGALIAAGTDTTSSSLTWAITLCAKYQNIQKLVRKELMKCYINNIEHNNNNNNNNNKKRLFDINWMNQLVYHRAFIYEVLRVSSVTKFGLPHYAADDIIINDENNKEICIPKGTIIGYGIEFVHKNTDKENWVNSSSEMCLENWINPNNNKFELNESFLTFGSGRRDCVGKSLAVKELIIIIAYLLLNYQFKFKNKNQQNKPIQSQFNGINVITPPIGVIVTAL